jgi:PQQ-dependent dehydrogenase (methanol/ethanol family)
MKRAFAVLAALAALGTGIDISGQQTAPSSPDIARGTTLFADRCASCHGQGAIGGDKAPALADNRRVRGLGDGELQNIMRSGTPNGMPAFALPPDDLRAVTAFVRSLNGSAFEAHPQGDIARGEQFFFGRGECSSCHIALGRGKAIGPDLSSIGRQLTLQELRTALVDPSASIAEGYGTVRVRLRDGRTLQGFARNEGNHTLPLQTLDGRLVSIDKDTASITRDPTSAMPPLQATPDEQRDLIAYLSTLAGGAASASDGTLSSSGDFDQILHPKPGDWPTYHGRLDGNRHSALDQITGNNVGDLSLQWVYTMRAFNLEMTPLVLDGVMYATGPNQVSALDARSGREIWRYSRPRSQGLRGDAASGLNRGVALVGDRVFYVTDDARLLGLSRLNGALLWEVSLPQNSEQPYGGTMAPLVVGDLVIAGVSGADEGIRGFLAAYNVATGKEAWRFWTVPAPGERGSETWHGSAIAVGGGSTWLAGTYDSETETLYWPTGNPFPDTDATEREGDNLYTNCILALDVKTGKLKWHYQTTPADLHDWDAEEPPVLVDARFQGANRKLLLQANRNGFFYVLDRTNGKVLLAKPFVNKLTWASGIGADGRPQLLPGNAPTPTGTLTCPAIRGATNWWSTAYNPGTRAFYVMAVENCGTYRSTQFSLNRAAGGPPARGTPPGAPAGAGGGAGRGGMAPDAGRGGFTPPIGFNGAGPNAGGQQFLRALDIETGKVLWEIPQTGSSNNYAGTLSTSGGVVFYGASSGEFSAVDAKTGRHLWHFETQEAWKASPMTYMVDGRQYVAIAAGANILSFALPSKRTSPPARSR